jgi:translation initiation factor 1
MRGNLFEIGAKFEREVDDSTLTLERSKHNLKIKTEKRRGKIVTTVGEFFLHKDELQKLSKEFKNKLATGGSIKDKNMEFQGEVVEKLKTLLVANGFKI